MLRKLRQLLLISTFCLFAISSQAFESEGVRKIMKQMNQDLIKAQTALLSGNHEELLGVAKSLQKSPDLSFMDKIRIFTEVGTKAKDFKDWRDKVTVSATQLEIAVHAKNGPQTLKAYNEILNTCFGCHQQFADFK